MTSALDHGGSMLMPRTDAQLSAATRAPHQPPAYPMSSSVPQSASVRPVSGVISVTFVSTQHSYFTIVFV